MVYHHKSPDSKSLLNHSAFSDQRDVLWTKLISHRARESLLGHCLVLALRHVLVAFLQAVVEELSRVLEE